MNRKQHKWAGFRAPKLRICTPDIIDHIVLHRRHSPPKTSSTDTIRSGRACQKPLLPASSPPKSDDQNSQKSFNNSQLGPGIPSMSTFCGQYSLEKNFLIVRSQVFRTFQVKVWGKTVPPCQNRPALYNGAVNMISRYYRYILVNATVNSFGFFS